MTIIEKIHTSFTMQLSLWVAGFVLVISGVVIFLLMRFSQNVIRDESIDITQQVLENTALRIDNTLRLVEMSARQEQQQLWVNRGRIEQIAEENGYEAIIRQSMPNAKLFVTRRDNSQLSTYIAGNERGYRQMFYDDREIFLFSQPIADRPFSLVAVCPADDIYGKYSRMHHVLLGWGIGGVLILLYILYIVVGRHLLPLHRLADTAQSIANGRIDTPIPEAHHEHEAGRLQNSLKKMQSSLSAYMDEMQQKQTALSRHNAELQAAYAEAEAYETLKAKFLHSMTDRMAAPVEQVCRSTEMICRDYHLLAKPQMVALKTDILQATETITDLLDQLMAEPSMASQEPTKTQTP